MQIAQFMLWGVVAVTSRKLVLSAFDVKSTSSAGSDVLAELVQQATHLVKVDRDVLHCR